MADLFSIVHLSLLLLQPGKFSQLEKGSNLLRASLFGRVISQKLFVYRTIKYDKMGWDCLGTLQNCCMSYVFLTLQMLRQQSRDLPVTIRRGNLGGGMTLVVLEMEIRAILE